MLGSCSSSSVPEYAYLYATHPSKMHAPSYIHSCSSSLVPNHTQLRTHTCKTCTPAYTTLTQPLHTHTHMHTHLQQSWCGAHFPGKLQQLTGAKTLHPQLLSKEGAASIERADVRVHKMHILHSKVFRKFKRDRRDQHNKSS